MNDGNYVYITLYKITSINEYIKIVSTLDNIASMVPLVVRAADKFCPSCRDLFLRLVKS